ncbi:hypothetical protein PV396_41880 [Streptomyces sp. ME02-8801-2C]|uniref:hypothetical protein n=1 Tax=Streptomyces sp. ME02-8801-2C TaxID=3028680 RepID=UPI0029A78B20|nr:hypothetical protein [Streptomyces sp. ME02-8801-2C]MDX3458415.1 hypothetical protein [Streptomyces sp. ME02-8801-2C]
MSRYPIPRPTEHAAIRAVCRSARPALNIPAILADLITAQRLGDQHGMNLCGHLVARAALKEVGE